MSISQVEKRAWKSLRDLAMDMNSEMSRDDVENKLRDLRQFVQNEGPLELVQKQAAWINPTDDMLWHVVSWICIFHAFMNTEIKRIGKDRMTCVSETKKLEIPTIRYQTGTSVKQTDHLEDIGAASQFAVYLAYQKGAPIELWKDLIPVADVLSNNEALCVLAMHDIEEENMTHAEKYLTKLRKQLGENIVTAVTLYGKIVARKQKEMKSK